MLIKFFVIEKFVTETSPVLSAGKNPGKLREAQLQLQRKLQQREHIRDQKHRNVETVLQVFLN